jgi:hypothetical protein
MQDASVLASQIFFLAHTLRGLLREASQADSLEDARIVLSEADGCLDTIFQAIKSVDDKAPDDAAQL